MKNKIIVTCCALLCAIFCGCKNEPTIESMEKLGTASGYTVAYILNKQATVNDTARQTIIDIMTIVQEVTPASNSTYEATWTPIVKNELQKLVDAGKIPQNSADYIAKDFSYIVGLLDKYIEKKEIRNKTELVDAFIRSFCSSFLTNFKPANKLFGTSVQEIDQYTEEYMNSVIK